MEAPYLMNLFKFLFQRSRNPIELAVPNFVASQSFYLDDFGIVTVTIQPQQLGRVEYRATWWNAVCPHDVVLLPGTRVRVIDMVNITLVVEPIVPANPKHQLAKAA